MVVFGACAACVHHSFAVPSNMAPVLAFEAVDGFFFVLAWFEVFQVDVESLVDCLVGHFCSCQGD